MRQLIGAIQDELDMPLGMAVFFGIFLALVGLAAGIIFLLGMVTLWVKGWGYRLIVLAAFTIIFGGIRTYRRMK